MGLPRARQTTAVTLAIVMVAALMGVPALLAVSPAGAAPAAVTQAQCGTDLSSNPAAPTISADVTTIGADQTATVNVSGSRYLTGLYQCGANKFGGVYLFFGWVQPGSTWGPSHRDSTSMQGQFGTSYSYPGEGGGGEVRDDGSGIVRLVSFTNGGESGTATDFHMDANGNWQASLVVRGATYSFMDTVSGARSTVDCRQVQCGVFTIGAHGISSRTNEVFVPITFTDAAGTPIVPPAGAVAGAGGAADTAPDGSGDQADPGTEGSGGTGTTGGGAGAPSTTVAPAVTTDSTTATSTTAAGDGTDRSDDPSVLASETAASVQDFDNAGGGGSAPILIVGLLVLLAAGVAGVVVLRRRAAKAAAASSGQDPAAVGSAGSDGSVGSTGTPR